MAVNLFGQAADFGPLLALAKEHNLKIIEDNAQAPAAKWQGRYTGTIGDIGVFSFNFHKTMQSGEGGILVTNSDAYALRAQLCRNHGESVVDGMPAYDGGPIFGSNYRMTELTAAIAESTAVPSGFSQCKESGARAVSVGTTSAIPGLTLPYVAPRNEHVYFAYVITVDEKKLGLTRDRLVEAMRAEGFPMSRGYQKPLHLYKLFQEQRAFNNTHFPFKSEGYDGAPDYSKASVP